MENFRIKIQKILKEKGFNLGTSGPNKDGVDGIVGPLTLGKATKWLKSEHVKLGYLWFHKGGISLRITDTFTNGFTELFFVVRGGEVVSVSPWTTKPGSYWIQNPVTVGGVKGTGIQKEGQWIHSHEYVAKPKRKWGKAGYFKQVGTIEVYRDGDRDNTLDKNVTQFAPTWYGFFLHAMGSGRNIYNWSAGCCGAPLAYWQKYIDPYFKNGDVISHTIINL